MAGGHDGMVGSQVLRRGKTLKHLGSSAALHVVAGDHLVIETPGGGGWGTPIEEVNRESPTEGSSGGTPTEGTK